MSNHIWKVFRLCQVADELLALELGWGRRRRPGRQGAAPRPPLRNATLCLGGRLQDPRAEPAAGHCAQPPGCQDDHRLFQVKG